MKPTRKPMRRKASRWGHRIRFSAYIAGAALFAGFVIFQASQQDHLLDDLGFVDGRPINNRLLALPPNQWVKISPQLPAFMQALPAAAQMFYPAPSLGWHRQGHAGLAFDSLRDSLLIFGSDSHGENWDNSVHEFSLLTLEWNTHYPASAKETYRANESGAAVAGDKGEYPWAMHSYDSIAYAPEIDALVLSASTDHTPPPTESAKNARANPTWIYHLEARQWEILPQIDAPSFFAAGSAYDSGTHSIWAYKKGQLWRFDLLQKKWIKTAGRHSIDVEIHYTLATDAMRHQLLIFGNYNGSNAIWTYTPAMNPDQEGKWEKKQPSGDACPKDEHLPVAYDSHQGVFLLLPDESQEKSITLIYSPKDNRYIRVYGAEMPATKMNYMMEYDPYHRLFLLVTGAWDTPVEVWAFRLDLNAL
jgi:hypothetical protein